MIFETKFVWHICDILVMVLAVYLEIE